MKKMFAAMLVFLLYILTISFFAQNYSMQEPEKKMKNKAKSSIKYLDLLVKIS